MSSDTTDDSIKALFVMRGPNQTPPARTAATQPPKRAAASTEGYVYVLEFSSGRIKVGFTTNPKSRLSNHATTAKAHGASIERTWLSPYHLEARANEKRMLAMCRSLDGAEAEGEYFAGVPWDTVVTYANSELTISEVEPGMSASEQRKAAEREERMRLLDAHEERTEFVRRRVHAKLREAGIQIERVSAQKWLMDPAVTRVLARLHDGEAVEPQVIRDAFNGKPELPLEGGA